MSTVIETRQSARVQEIARWINVFVRPRHWTEMRVIHRNKTVASQFFNDADQMAEAALAAERADVKGVYFVPNPIRDVAAKEKRAACDADIEERRWILIDIDPERPADTSATEEERQAAWTVLDRCRGTLEAAGLENPVIGDSGNGWHLCYQVELPNDIPARNTVQRLLKSLNRRCGDRFAKVDVSTFNASRIWKLYGTQARKGPNTPDRPHRVSRLVEEK